MKNEEKKFSTVYYCGYVTIDKITVDRETDKAYFELSYEDDKGLHKVEFNTFLGDTNVTAESTSFINTAIKLPAKVVEVK